MRREGLAFVVWWNSALPRARFQAALKQAYYATRGRRRDGQITGRPMTYYFGILDNAVVAACEEAGLPPPRRPSSPAHSKPRARSRPARGSLPARAPPDTGCPSRVPA